MWKLIGLLVQLYPLLSQLIQDFEASDMSGAQKKQAVIQTVEAMLTDVGIDFSKYESLLSDAIDVIVDAFNFLGIFKHRKSTTVEPSGK